MRFLRDKEVKRTWHDEVARMNVYRAVWRKKKILRRIYFDKWKDMMVYFREGKVLEIGSGPGHFREFYPKAILMDIIHNPWLNVTGDAQALPFKNESISTVVFVDVLHHISNPFGFMKEIERVLKRNGRLIFEEPYVSPLSFLIYKTHHEDLDTKYVVKFNEQNKSPLEANLAMPTLMLFRDYDKIKYRFLGLHLYYRDVRDFFLLFLSGNFTYRQIVPDSLYPVLKALERFLKPIKYLCAFKMFIVMEKK